VCRLAEVSTERTQVLIDTELLERVRSVARHSGRSVSAVVRDALSRYLEDEAEPDSSWMGAVKIDPKASHRSEDIDRSVREAVARNATKGWKP
jgi:hypothetical protein